MKKVAVIGAGASGLAAIKTCLENDLEVVCYEWNTDIGGIWFYKEKAIEGMGSVAKSTILNISKEIMAYSDFPPPEYFPNFMHHTEMLQYLNLYAENFNLLPYIKFRHRVTEVIPAVDYDVSGKWRIKIINEANEMDFFDEVNAVMVCVGHHGYPNRIEFQDQEKFCGSIIHNHEFKDPKHYENKKVLVVGAGNSAVDAAVDLSYVAEKTYLSTRRGFWLWKRTEEYGIPYDIHFINRLLFTLFRYVPLNLSCWYMERNFNKWFNHEMYQLTPSHRVMNQFPTVNDFLPSRILSGRIKIKGNIEKFTENGVIFENGEFIEVNEIILATGYKIKYPFLKNIKIDNNHIELYKYIFPPDLKFPTLGIIGCVSVIGGYPVIGEMQCRYFTDVLNKKILLPTSKEMKDDIQKQFQIQKQLFYISERHNINVFYIDYLDEIANLIGVKPNIMKLFWTDPILFKKLLFGPCLPYQYRLQGTNAWSRAREAILSFDQRVLVPLRTRYNVNNKKNFSKKKIIILFTIMFLVLITLKIRNKNQNIQNMIRFIYNFSKNKLNSL